MKGPRILVVHRRSVYMDVFSDNRHPEIKKMIRAKHPLVKGLIAAHNDHVASMKLVKKALSERRISNTWRHHLDGIVPDDFDLIVTVGGDGTVLHASHAIDNTPVLAVNSAPNSSFGFFTSTDAASFGGKLDQVLKGEVKPVKLSRMEVRVNGKVVTDRALNDVLFCHDCPASTTRYVLSYGGSTENQLSSGVWIATAAGSTAAIKSAGGRTMTRGSKRLQFQVRELMQEGWGSSQTRPTMIHGFIKDDETLTITSRTECAQLYVDGPHVVFSVSFGDEVRFSNAKRPLNLFMSEKNR